MAMLKVIEILAESDKSWEDAAQVAVTTAAKTVRHIKSIYVENLSATIAYADLGNIVIRNHQNGAYVSLQAGL